MSVMMSAWRVMGRARTMQAECEECEQLSSHHPDHPSSLPHPPFALEGPVFPRVDRLTVTVPLRLR